jgi:hypothetical protein
VPKVNGQYESAYDLASKVDNEGGVTDAIIGYGIPPKYLPDDVPENIKAAWERVYGIGDDVEFIAEWLDVIRAEDTSEETYDGEYDDE